MTPSGQFRPPPTAQQAVLAELRRAILSGDLTPGSQIIQESLAEQFGVSRVPIREALRILEGEGQISYIPHRGYFVAHLSLDELLEIQRIRDLIEPEAVRKALPRLNGEDIGRMQEAFDEMQEAAHRGDIAAMNSAHIRFHFALFEACDMARLVRILRQLWEASDPYRAVYHGDEAYRKAAQREHRQIFGAAKARDKQALLKLLSEHRQHTVDRLKEPLTRGAALPRESTDREPRGR